MSQEQPNNPLHGLTLKFIVTDLVERFGFEQLGNFIDINCFRFDPSINSSLKFLRRTPWAREKVEQFYLETLPMKAAPDKQAEVEEQAEAEEQAGPDGQAEAEAFGRTEVRHDERDMNSTGPLFADSSDQMPDQVDDAAAAEPTDPESDSSGA